MLKYKKYKIEIKDPKRPERKMYIQDDTLKYAAKIEIGAIIAKRFSFPFCKDKHLEDIRHWIVKEIKKNRVLILTPIRAN